jgi:starvation-inducible DNA-binding protein
MFKKISVLGYLILLGVMCGMPLLARDPEGRRSARRAARQEAVERELEQENSPENSPENSIDGNGETETIGFGVNKIDNSMVINKKGSRMVNLGMDYQKQAQVADSLNTLLAHEYVLYTETLNFHWNVRGPHFGPLHELFGKQYEQLLEIADRVAERVRALGGFSLGTLPEFLERSTLVQKPGKSLDAMTMIAQLVEDHETVIQLIRDYSAQAAQARDEGSVNMLGDLIETHEKMAWFLRSHLEK